jgi:hypothetical protein
LRYGECGNEIEKAYFDTQVRAILAKDTGDARETTRYDGYGNATEWLFYYNEGIATLE